MTGVQTCALPIYRASSSPLRYAAPTHAYVDRIPPLSHQTHIDESAISLLPLHGFSHALKPLHVEYGTFPFPRILNLINSFPLLEDLWLMVWGGDSIGDVDTQPAVFRRFNLHSPGSLKLGAQEGMNRIVSQLFPPQNGLQFRRLDLRLSTKDDIFVVSAL